MPRRRFVPSLGLDRPVHLLGYWWSVEAPNWPTPQAFVDPDWDPAEREAVARYLDAGRLDNQQAGFSWCRFRCGTPHLGSREWTDGYYRWPEGLSHYVRVHQVRLPQPFVDHALHRPWFGYWIRRLLVALLEWWPGLGAHYSEAWWQSFPTATQVGSGEITAVTPPA